MQAFYYMRSVDDGTLFHAVFDSEAAKIIISQGDSVVQEIETVSAQGGHLHDWAMANNALPVVEVTSLEEATQGSGVSSAVESNLKNNPNHDPNHDPFYGPSHEIAHGTAHDTMHDTTHDTTHGTPHDTSHDTASSDASSDTRAPRTRKSSVDQATRNQQTGAMGGDGGAG